MKSPFGSVKTMQRICKEYRPKSLDGSIADSNSEQFSIRVFLNSNLLIN